MLMGVAEAFSDNPGKTLKNDNAGLGVILAEPTKCIAFELENITGLCAQRTGRIVTMAQCGRPAEDIVFADFGNDEKIAIRWFVLD